MSKWCREFHCAIGFGGGDRLSLLECILLPKIIDNNRWSHRIRMKLLLFLSGLPLLKHHLKCLIGWHRIRLCDIQRFQIKDGEISLFCWWCNDLLVKMPLDEMPEDFRLLYLAKEASRQEQTDVLSSMPYLSEEDMVSTDYLDGEELETVWMKIKRIFKKENKKCQKINSPSTSGIGESKKTL